MNKLKFLCAASLAAVLALVSACGGSDDAGPLNVSFAIVDTDTESGIHEQRFAVIKSAADWSLLWKEHKTHNPGSPPMIDFSQNMAIGVFLGLRGCSSVAIKRVVQSANKITIQYREILPDFTMSCAAVLAFPSQIATIPASNLPVEFTAVESD